MAGAKTVLYLQPVGTLSGVTMDVHIVVVPCAKSSKRLIFFLNAFLNLMIFKFTSVCRLCRGGNGKNEEI